MSTVTKQVKEKVLKLNVSKDFKANVRRVVNADIKVNEYNNKREAEGLTLVQSVIKEIISLKKQVDVPKNVRDANEYKLRIIKHSLKEISTNAYYLKILDLSFKYIRSGYTVNFKEITVPLLTKLLELKPSKNSVKSCKTLQELKELVHKKEVELKQGKKKELKEKLPKAISSLLESLNPEEFAILKKYIAG